MFSLYDLSKKYFKKDVYSAKLEHYIDSQQLQKTLLSRIVSTKIDVINYSILKVVFLSVSDTAKTFRMQPHNIHNIRGTQVPLLFTMSPCALGRLS